MQSDIIAHVTKDHTFKNEKLYYKFIMDLSKVPNLETIKYTSVRKKNKASSNKSEQSKSGSNKSQKEIDAEEKYESQLLEVDRVKQISTKFKIITGCVLSFFFALNQTKKPKIFECVH